MWPWRLLAHLDVGPNLYFHCSMCVLPMYFMYDKYGELNVAVMGITNFLHLS